MTQVGKIMMASQMLGACLVNLRDKVVFANLILLDIANYDVILDMDWLSWHHACLIVLIKQLLFGSSVFSYCVSRGVNDWNG